MAEYVTRCSLELNGVVFEDFSSFKENSVTLSKPVALMNKSGTAKMLPRYGFSVDAKLSSVPAGINPLSIYGGTFTVQYDNGDRVSFGGVATNETGEISIDGENEASYTITYSAESRTPDLSL